MLNISHHGINAILSNILNDSDKMIWVTDGAYKRDVYLSSRFEEIMGPSAHQVMHQDFRKFYEERLANIHDNNIFQVVEQNLSARSPAAPTTTYCVYDKNDQLQFIEDTLLCTLEDRAKNEQYIVGVMRNITETEYTELRSRGILLANPLEEIITDIQKIIPDNSIQHIIEDTQKNTTAVLINDNYISLTQREAECLCYLLQGMSTKLIARRLDISSRTVEIHITNIKRKTNMSSRIELLSKIRNADAFLRNHY